MSSVVKVWITTEPMEKGNKTSNVCLCLSLVKEEFTNLRETCKLVTRIYTIMVQAATGICTLYLINTLLSICIKNHLR